MEFSNQELLAEAVRIGDQLLEESQVDRNGRYWLTVNQVGTEIHWEAETSLYNGVSGIALFLLTLYQQTQEERFRNAAWEGLQWVEQQKPRENDTLAFLTGKLSVPFAWLRSYQILEDDYALSRANKHVSQLLPDQVPDTVAEYINGISGTVVGLLHLHHATQNEQILRTLDQYVAQLLATVHCHQTGLYWDRSSQNVHGLCGFSHGASGVGYTFLELGHYFQNPAFFWLAEQAFSYERAYYNSEAKNWPDFRMSLLTEEDEQTFQKAYQQGKLDFFTRGTDMNAWCHGAAGIGLSRLRAYEQLGKLVYFDEAVAATEKTKITDLNSLVPATCTLCHGRGGNADLFLEAFRVLRDSRYQLMAQGVAQRALHTWQQKGLYRSGTRYEGEDRSLFNGIAGIGYFYLRVLSPRQVPSVLAPQLTATYPSVLNADEYPHLALSAAEVQEQLLEKRFPRTVHLIRDLNHGQDLVNDASLTSLPLYRRSYWQDFALRQANQLPVNFRAGVIDVWRLEDSRAALDEQIKSDALLLFKQRQKAVDAERLLSLDKPALMREVLQLDPDITLQTTSWNWSQHTTESWVNNLQEDESDHTVLLIPTSLGIREQSLNAFGQTILEAFIDEKTVAEGMQIVKSQVADPITSLRVEELMLKQIRAAINVGLLIDPTKHPLQVTVATQYHTNIQETR